MSTTFTDHVQDTQQPATTQPATEPVVDVQPAQTEPVVQPATDTTPPVTEPQPATPQEYEIDGIGKVTPEQIKEWNLGYMRQSDYTRKTQEVAQQRKEAEKALEVYNYLQANPSVAQSLARGEHVDVSGTPLEKANPVLNRVESTEHELAALKLDAEINRLKATYPDFNEVEVLRAAEEKGIVDLEFVYKATRNTAQQNTVDIDALKAQIRSELTEQIRRDGLATQTIITTGDVQPAPQTTLTPAEKAMADNMGISYELWAKHKK